MYIMSSHVDIEMSVTASIVCWIQDVVVGGLGQLPDPEDRQRHGGLTIQILDSNLPLSRNALNRHGNP